MYEINHWYRFYSTNFKFFIESTLHFKLIYSGEKTELRCCQGYRLDSNSQDCIGKYSMNIASIL